MYGLVMELIYLRESYVYCGECFWECFENIIFWVRRVEKGGRSFDGNVLGILWEFDDVDVCYFL